MNHSNYNKRKIKTMKANLTAEREAEIKKALTDYQLPWITRIFKKVWFYFLKYTFVPVFAILIILFIAYNSMSFFSPASEVIWIICKTIFFVYIFGVGGFAMTAAICENVSVSLLCKRLNITHDELQFYVIIYQIKG